MPLHHTGMPHTPKRPLPGKKPRWTAKRIALGITVSLLAVTAAITFGNGASAKSTDKKTKPVASSQQSAVPADANPLTKAFAGKGVTSCAARINQVTNFLGSGGTTGAFLFIPSQKVNQQLVSASMEVVDKDKKSAYMSASFASNQANGCGAVYDAIAWWPNKCEEVASSQFNGKKSIGNLKQSIGVLDLGPTTRVFLMPAGDGCISIKKEVVSQ